MAKRKPENQIDNLILDHQKSGIDPISLCASGMRHTVENLLTRGYNFALDLIVIRGLHTKLWGPKVAGVPTLGILGLPFGSFETKCHLDVALVERRKVYYKGEGGGFPQVWAVVSLVSPNLLVARLNTKNAQTMH
jgi:hypothetical protein